MFIEYIILSYLTYIISSTIIKYDKLILEPFSMLERNRYFVDGSNDWYIKLNLIFGKQAFIAEYRNVPNDEYCGNTRCIRTRGFSIEYKYNSSVVLHSLFSSTTLPIRSLTEQEQQNLLEEINGSIETISLSEADYITLPDDITGPIIQNNNIKSIAILYRNRLESVNWSFALVNTKLLYWPPENGEPDILDGSPVVGDASAVLIFRTTDMIPHTRNVEQSNSCKFSRELLKIYFCSNAHKNDDLCDYYIRIIEQNKNCGEEPEEREIKVF